MWVARSLRSHVAEAHVVVRLRRRIQAARIRFVASIRTKGTTPVVVVVVLSFALIVGLVVIELPSSGSSPRRPHETPSADVQPPPLGSRAAPKGATPPARHGAARARTRHRGRCVTPRAPRGLRLRSLLDPRPKRGFDVAGMTTLDYFSVGIDPNGTLDESGAGLERV